MSERGNPAIKVRLEPEVLALVAQRAHHLPRGRGGGVAYYVRSLVYRDLGLPVPDQWAVASPEQAAPCAPGLGSGGHSDEAVVQLWRLPFLDALYNAYLWQTGQTHGSLERLQDLYHILTIPRQARREYSLQRFGQDLYRLDAQRDASTSSGAIFRLHPGATAARKRSNLIVVTSWQGEERTYYGIEFHMGTQGERFCS